MGIIADSSDVKVAQKIDGDEYIVCFYDIMGQREWMKNAIDESGQLLPENQLVLNKQVDFLRQTVSVFRNRVNELAKEKAFDIQEGQDYGVQQFSDSTVLYIRSSHEWCAYILHLWLLDISFNALWMQAIGLCIRGAITKGLAWHVEGGQLCGPALDEVESIEKRSAYYSRVVFSDELVRWIAAGLDKKEISEFERNGYLCVKALMQWECDAECSLNMLSHDMLERLKSRGDLPLFNRLYHMAYGNTLQQKSALKNDVAWKYIFQEYSYQVHSSLVEPFLLPEHGKPLVFADKEPQVAIDDYYVGYFKIMPLCAIPAIEELSKNGCYNLGWGICGPETAKIFAIMLEHLRSCPVPCKVQQISNYVMFFVQDDGTLESRQTFMRSFQVMRKDIMLALSRDHMVAGSLVLGKGWLIGRDCLCGPVVGEADRIAIKDMPYPRVVISQFIYDNLSEPEKLNCISNEPDGLHAWRMFDEGTNQKILFESLRRLLLRQQLLWHFSFRSERTSSFARQLALYIHMQMFNMHALGMDEIIHKANIDVQWFMKTHCNLELGAEPCILSQYAKAPPFPSRADMAIEPLRIIPTIDVDIGDSSSYRESFLRLIRDCAQQK